MKKPKIKSYLETSYKVVEKNGKIQKGEIIEDSMPFSPSSTKIVFNKHGNKIEEYWFNTNEGLLLKNTYKYDRKRNIVEQGGSFKKKFTYEYDEKGNKTKEIICDSDGGLICTITYVFDEKGNRTEENVYDSNGNLEFKYTYKYDEKGNVIAEKWYGSKGIISYYRFVCDEEGKIKELYNMDSKYTYTYNYDQKGNWIEKIEYKNDIPKAITVREIEYYH